jgi:hypothetical protein
MNNAISQADFLNLDRSHPMMKDLVGWWPLQEGAGLTAFDLSLNRNNGTLTNMDQTTDWVIGHYGGHSLDFDGSNDYVNIPHHAGFDFGAEDFFLSCWVKPTTTNPYQINKQSLIRKDDGSNPGRDWGLFIQAGGTVRIGYFVAGTQVNKDSTGTVSVNAWNHVVGQRVGNSFEIYINGVLDSSGTTDGSHGTADSSSEPVSLARRSAPGNEEYLTGALQDCRIGSKSLTASEVLNLYLNPWAPFQQRNQVVVPAQIGEEETALQHARLRIGV